MIDSINRCESIKSNLMKSSIAIFALTVDLIGLKRRKKDIQIVEMLFQLIHWRSEWWLICWIVLKF